MPKQEIDYLLEIAKEIDEERDSLPWWSYKKRNMLHNIKMAILKRSRKLANKNEDK